jgi:TolB-like protein
MSTILCAVAAAIAVTATASAQTDTAAGGSKKVMVSSIRVVGAPDALAEQIAERIVAEIRGQAGYSAVTASEIRAMLEQNIVAQIDGCADADCFAPAAEAIDAHLVIFGSVGKVGSSLVVALTLADMTTQRTLANVAETVQSPEQAVGAAASLVAAMFGFEGKAESQPHYQLPKGKKKSLAVFDLRGLEVSTEAAQSLSQVLAVGLKQIEGVSVITQADIQSMLQLEAQKQQLGCDDEGCFAEIGGALGVDLLVTGTVGKLSEQYVVSLQLINARRGKVEARLTESFRGEEAQLVGAVRHAGRNLLGINATEPGSLALSASEPDAEIFIDDEQRGELPMPAINGLVPGRYRVRVSKSGFFDWQNEVYVEPNGTTPVWAALEPAPPKFYQRWWFWTAVGAVVVGAGTFYIVSARALPDTDLGSVNVR